MNLSSCKRDTKSKSHPGMKRALVRVFSCKHPIKEKLVALINEYNVFVLYRSE